MALNRKSSILCQLYEKKHFTSKEFRRLCKYIRVQCGNLPRVVHDRVASVGDRGSV